MSKIVIKKLPMLEQITTEQFSGTTSKEVINSNFLFLKIAAEINNEFEDLLAEYDLSPGRHTLLSLLNSHKDGMAPSALSAELGVTQATISGLLNSLEKDRLIGRSKRLGDARSFAIKITPEGVDLLKSVTPLIAPIIDKYWGRLTSDEHQILNSLLTQVHEKIK